MTISIWRYSHLALAISSFLFLLLASLTGIILSVKPVAEKTRPYRSAAFNDIQVAELIPVLKQSFSDISEVKVDANQFVIVNGTAKNDESGNFYVDPQRGTVLGRVTAENAFFEWVTDLHRSLFLKELGRFFVGLSAFLLLLITLSGAVLIVQRQRSIKRFFSRIIKDNLMQYLHVVVGRLSLIPILIIALSGTLLSLQRFELISATPLRAKVDFDALRTTPLLQAKDFEVFKNTPLNAVETIAFPFSEDVEDYFTLQLTDREITVNQLTGDVLTNEAYDKVTLLHKLSLSLHTGQHSAIWAIVLGIACINILFFIYSGFAMTIKRRRGRFKNKFKAADATYIILVGSENGTTLQFAKLIWRELLRAGKSVYMGELNALTAYPNASQLVVFTATYGQGDPPTNATRFLARLGENEQQQPLHFSVVAFGSKAYPDFCAFGYAVHQQLLQQDWARPLLEVHTVNDRSPQEFETWATQWGRAQGLPLQLPADFAVGRGLKKQKFVVSYTGSPVQDEQSFLIRLTPLRAKAFTSGDLLSVYPADDYRERLYSIGKVANAIQLSVKVRTGGLGSSYLNQLRLGQQISASIVANPHFHFPKQARRVIMISNGTGIAPFLGMIDQYGKRSEIDLYCGFRSSESFRLYEDALHQQKGLLRRLNVAFSREGEKQYVKDLLARDADLIVNVLKDKGVLMICGSLQMQKDVFGWLAVVLAQHQAGTLSELQARGQLLTDCY